MDNCPFCSYPMDGGICPECGATVIAVDSDSTRRRAASERFWLMVLRVVGFGLMHYILFTGAVTLALADGLMPEGPPSVAARFGDFLCGLLTIPSRLITALCGGGPAVRGFCHAILYLNCIIYGAIYESIYRGLLSFVQRRDRESPT